MKNFTRMAAVAAAASFATFASAADSELVILEWAGFDDPNFFQNYIDQHGDAPTFAFFGEEEEAFHKLRSGFRADVSHPCSQSVSKWHEAGLLEPLDPSRIDRWDDVNEVMKEGFKFDGEYFLLPMDWGSTALTYRADLVDEADIQSLQAFLNPDFAGRISLPDNVDDVYALALLATGNSDWTTATVADVEKASAWLREVHKNVRTYWIDPAELAQLMSSGEVIIAWAWNQTPAQMSAEGHPVTANRETAEGSSTWFCGYVNLANGPNPEDKMYDFFNAWLNPKSTAYIVSEWGYGHGNQTALTELGQQAVDDAGLGEVDVPLLAQVPLSSEIRELMIREFEMIKAGF